MEQVFPLQQASKSHHHQQARKIAIGVRLVQAVALTGYQIQLTFSDDSEQIIDFELPLKKYGKAYPKYLQPSHFIKFKIAEGNLVWGNNWDIIFPLHQLYADNIK